MASGREGLGWGIWSWGGGTPPWYNRTYPYPTWHQSTNAAPADLKKQGVSGGAARPPGIIAPKAYSPTEISMFLLEKTDRKRCHGAAGAAELRPLWECGATLRDFRAWEFFNPTVRP